MSGKNQATVVWRRRQNGRMACARHWDRVEVRASGTRVGGRHRRLVNGEESYTRAGAEEERKARGDGETVRAYENYTCGKGGVLLARSKGSAV